MNIEDTLYRVGINDFLEVAGNEVIKDFYIGPFTEFQQFLSSGNSYIMDGVMLSFYLKGSVLVCINGQDYRIDSNSILVLLPNQLVQLKARSEDVERKSFHISFDMVAELPSPVNSIIFDMARRCPVLHISQLQMSNLIKNYSLIEERYAEANHAYRREIVKSLLYVLMLDICDIYELEERALENDVVPKSKKMCDDFFLLLTENYKKQRTVAFYAEKMNRSPRYLARAILKITGRSITEWIDDAVISEIKIRLKTTEQSVYEISEDLNFSSPPVFIQFFKRHTGVTPLVYRRQI